MTYIIFLIRKWTVRALIGAGIIFVGTACSNSNNDKPSSTVKADSSLLKKDINIKKANETIDNNKLQLDKNYKKKSELEPVETVYGPPPTSDDKDTQVKKK